MHSRWLLRPTLLFAALVAASLAAPLYAQDDTVDWLNDYKEAIQEAKKTGKPIFLEYRCEP
jgi:hypothetical protein